MNRNKTTSYLKFFVMILMSFFEVLFCIILIISMLIDSTKEFKLNIAFTLLSLFLFHYFFIRILDIIFSKYGKNRIIFSDKKIIFMGNIIFTDTDCRILYSKISFQNILNACAGELTIIYKDRGFVLGLFTRREINKIKRFIPNITDETHFDNARAR